MMKVKYYKCPECNSKFKTLNGWGNHVTKSHPNIIPEDYSIARYFYFTMTGKTHGVCRTCKGDTEWNEESQKYDQYCKNPECKKAYVKIAKQRMIGKYGKVHLLNDPEMQKKMLSNRKISGKYKFQDGTQFEYVGSYEREFLAMLDTMFEWHSNDLIAPSPHTYYYDYKNANDDPKNEGVKFYIPDFYIPSLNLEIEIKQQTSTNKAYNDINKVKEKLKDEVMQSNKNVNYIKINDNDFTTFFEFLLKAREYVPTSDELKKDQMELVVESAIDLENANESYFISRDDMKIDIDKFEDGTSNILLITGLSGSGKSTTAQYYAKKYHAEWIELDWFEKNYGMTDDQLKECSEALYEYLTNTDKGKLFRQLSLSDDKPSGSILINAIKAFGIWLLKWCEMHKNKKWIIEGVQIYSVFDLNLVKKYPIIIKGASMTKSIQQRIKREGHESEFVKMIQWYLSEEKSLNKFSKNTISNEGMINNTPEYYFLSEVSMNDELLQPRIPDNYLTKIGAEDSRTPRVCLSESIGGCLTALSRNLENCDLYVHVPDDTDIKIIHPNLTQVPDAECTDEVWCVKPVTLKCIGKIHVKKALKPLKYNYMKNGKKETAETYTWDWCWIDRWNDEGVSIINESYTLVKADPDKLHFVDENGNPIDVDRKLYEMKHGPILDIPENETMAKNEKNADSMFSQASEGDIAEEGLFTFIKEKVSDFKEKITPWKKKTGIDEIESKNFTGTNLFIGARIKNGMIEIRGINFTTLKNRIIRYYNDKSIYNMFLPKYNVLSYHKFEKKQIIRSQIKIDYLYTPEFFALELATLFMDLGKRFRDKTYLAMAATIYKNSWLSAADNKSEKTPLLDTTPLKNLTLTLEPYQKDFIEKYPKLKAQLNLNGYILAFEQGLGKTITATSLAECLKVDHVYIVCPNNLKANWALELQKYYKKYQEDEDLWRTEVFLCDRKANLFDESTVRFIITNNESIEKMYPYVLKGRNMLIIDESQNFRNLESKRVQQLLALRDKLHCTDVLALSGTPIKATPSEITPVLAMIDPTFTNEAAEAFNKAFKLNDSLGTSLVQARFGKIMYRKEKDVLSNKLPEKHVENMVVSIADGNKYILENVTAVVMKRFSEIYENEKDEAFALEKPFFEMTKLFTREGEDFNRFKNIIKQVTSKEIWPHEIDKIFAEQYMKNIVSRIKIVDDRNYYNFMIKKFVRFKMHCLGLAFGEILPKYRRDMFISMYDENKEEFHKMIKDNTKKTLIFSQFKDVANYIYNDLNRYEIGAVCITGDVKNRLEVLKEFKENDAIRVLVATSQTIGTGLTLTEASQMFFFGPPWRDSDFNQCSDRIHRIGQTDEVYIYTVSLSTGDSMNLSTRMDSILSWSKRMTDSVIIATDDKEDIDETHFDQVLKADESFTLIKAEPDKLYFIDDDGNPLTVDRKLYEMKYGPVLDIPENESMAKNEKNADSMFSQASEMYEYTEQNKELLDEFLMVDPSNKLNIYKLMKPGLLEKVIRYETGYHAVKAIALYDIPKNVILEKSSVISPLGSSGKFSEMEFTKFGNAVFANPDNTDKSNVRFEYVNDNGYEYWNIVSTQDIKKGFIISYNSKDKPSFADDSRI